MFDLMSVGYHFLRVGHDDGLYVRDAGNAGIAISPDFFEQVLPQELNVPMEAASSFLGWAALTMSAGRRAGTP